MTMLGRLPNLEMLRLKYFAIQGTNWNLSEGGFKKLKLLHILMTNLVQWKATSDSLPNLECLVIRHCYKLKEIPAEIGDIPTLKLIELHHCSQAVVTSAEEILEEQQSMGNEVLVVRTYNTGVQYFDMGGEEDEEAAIVSTYGSDMTYNQMSNMGYKIAAEVRKGVTSLTHTDEDLLKLLGRQKNRYSDVEEVECLRLITAELRLELRNPQLHEEILAKLRKRVIDTDTSGYLLSLLGHQKDEYSDVEEVVYLRSLAAILRHEIWNNPRPKLEYAASECDLRDTLSPKSEEKAKQLILECAASECDQWDTDLASSLSLPSSPGSEDNDITVNDSSSGRYRNSSQNSQFYSKLKRLIGQE